MFVTIVAVVLLLSYDCIVFDLAVGHLLFLVWCVLLLLMSIATWVCCCVLCVLLVLVHVV